MLYTLTASTIAIATMIAIAIREYRQNKRIEALVLRVKGE